MTFSHLHTCASKEWAHISELIAHWPFKPYSNHPDLFAIPSGRVIRTLESDQGAAWMMIQQNQTQGFTSLSMLPWDSELLGFAAGRIDYLVAEGTYQHQHKTKKSLLRHAINEATRRGISHLSVRIDANDLSSLHVLEEARFITVDNILTLALELNAERKSEELRATREATDGLPFPLCPISIREATENDSERAAHLALNVYSKDRFHSDPLINKDRADQLHAEWIRNSCRGIAADVVLLAERNQQLIGFITCKVQRDTKAQFGRTIGTIALVGCDEGARGRGVGQALTMASLAWFQQQGCDVVEVGTQLRNLPASRLYQKCGFGLVGSSTSLRLIL